MIIIGGLKYLLDLEMLMYLDSFNPSSPELPFISNVAHSAWSVVEVLLVLILWQVSKPTAFFQLKQSLSSQKLLH